MERRRGIEPRQRPYMIAILPVSGRTSQPGLLINVLRESDGLPVLEPGKGITPARAIAEPVLKLNLNQLDLDNLDVALPAHHCALSLCLL